MALTLTQKGSIATLFLMEMDYTIQELRELFYREAISMDKKSIEGLVEASTVFSKLSPEDKKFCVVINKCYTAEDLMKRIDATVVGAYRDRLERCAVDSGIL